MLGSVLIGLAVLVNSPLKPDQFVPKPVELWYESRPDLDEKIDGQSHLFYGLDEKELRDRFVAATSNAYYEAGANSDWFWVLRSFETDLGLRLDSAAAMRSWAGNDPRRMLNLRLPGTSSEARRLVTRFYDREAPKLLKKKKLELNLENAVLLADFRTACSAKRKKQNVKIYSHVAPLSLDAIRKSKQDHRGGYEFLVELRDRGCLSEKQFRKLAGPEVERLRKLMPTMVPADLVRAVYFLMHGGFAEAVEPEMVVRVAKGQGNDGNWGPRHKRNGAATPFYGAYVWASVLSGGGSPVTLAEFEAAQFDVGGTEEARGRP